MSKVKPYLVGGPHNATPLAAIGPFPEDEVRPCAYTGEPVYESHPRFLLKSGDWLSIEAVKGMFEHTLRNSHYHCAPAEWILTDLLERFGDRKERKPMCKKKATAILHKYNFTCVKCGSSDRLQVDHIVPVRKGGKDEMDNLQILCQPCNLRKGTKDNAQFMAHG